MSLRLLLPAAVYAAIIGLSSVPAGDLAGFPPALSYVGHALEYAALGAALRWALDGTRQATALTTGVILALAGLDEAYQSTVPGRDPSVLDWAVDLLAATVAAIIIGSSRFTHT